MPLFRSLSVLFICSALAPLCGCKEASPPDSSHASAQPSQREGFRIPATEADQQEVAALREHLVEGTKVVERFFGAAFPQAFECELCPDRKAFDDYFRKRWKVPKTEAWTVASGVADRMT